MVLEFRKPAVWSGDLDPNLLEEGDGKDQGLGFRVPCLGFNFKTEDLRFSVQWFSLGCRDQGTEFRVQRFL